MLSQKALEPTQVTAPDKAAEQSMGEIVGELATLSSELVRDEFALAKHEIREKLRSLSVSVLMGVVGALIGQAALLALSAAAALALVPVVGTWQAVLIIGGILLLAAAILGAVAVKRLKQLDLKPEQTLETLEEDKRWLKELT
jgi:uncharacterized membrane protein YqjE